MGAFTYGYKKGGTARKLFRHKGTAKHRTVEKHEQLTPITDMSLRRLFSLFEIGGFL